MKALAIIFLVIAIFFLFIGYPIVAVFFMALCALRSSNIGNYYPVVEDIEEFIQFQWNKNSLKVTAGLFLAFGLLSIILGNGKLAFILLLGALISGLLTL